MEWGTTDPPDRGTIDPWSIVPQNMVQLFPMPIYDKTSVKGFTATTNIHVLDRNGWKLYKKEKIVVKKQNVWKTL